MIDSCELGLGIFYFEVFGEVYYIVLYSFKLSYSVLICRLYVLLGSSLARHVLDFPIFPCLLGLHCLPPLILGVTVFIVFFQLLVKHQGASNFGGLILIFQSSSIVVALNEAGRTLPLPITKQIVQIPNIKMAETHLLRSVIICLLNSKFLSLLTKAFGGGKRIKCVGTVKIAA